MKPLTLSNGGNDMSMATSKEIKSNNLIPPSARRSHYSFGNARIFNGSPTEDFKHMYLHHEKMQYQMTLVRRMYGM